MKLDTSEVIFKPQPVRQFGHKRVLYIPCDTPIKSIQIALEKRAIKEKRDPMGHLFLFKNCSVLFNVIGAPMAVIGLERFIASGAEEIIILGFCGALEKNTKIGDPVVINLASSQEGTSRHYFPRRRIFRPSCSLKNELELTFVARKLPYFEGAVVTTDAPFRETKSWLARNTKKGIGYVDMEASAVFALAEFHGVNTAAMMLVSDNLSDSKHRIQLKHSRLLTNIKKYFYPFFK